MELVRVGIVESTLTDVAAAPKQGDEGAPEAWLVFDRRFATPWMVLPPVMSFSC
jgi:hypothetical protein